MTSDISEDGMCRVVATFSERRSIVAESLPIDRQRGAVSEPFEMIAARDAADEVELIAETEPVVGQKCVGALRSDGEEKFVVFAAGYGGFEIDGSGMHSVSTSAPTPDWCRICRRSEAMPSEMSIMACTSGRSPSHMPSATCGAGLRWICASGVSYRPARISRSPAPDSPSEPPTRSSRRGVRRCAV